jgi:hypothetical protein
MGEWGISIFFILKNQAKKNPGEIHRDQDYAF